jgi:excisionase family DNA binding protein
LLQNNKHATNTDYPVSPEDLQELLKQLLRSELDTLKEQIVKSKAEVFYTREETAERLKIDLSTLHRWTKSGKIIPHAIGSSYLLQRVLNSTSFS